MKTISLINKILLITLVLLLGYYVYQTISISSGNVTLVSLKKEFLERKNSTHENTGPDLISGSLGMTEVERFSYVIIGPSEFALIENQNGRQ